MRERFLRLGGLGGFCLYGVLFFAFLCFFSIVFLLSIWMRFLMILASKKGPNSIEHGVFFEFLGVPFRGHIWDGILGDFGMVKP